MKPILIITLFLSATSTVFAGGVVFWGTMKPTSNPPTLPSFVTNSFLTASAMTASPSLSYISGFNFKNWSTTNSINLGNYFEFSFSIEDPAYFCRSLSFTMEPTAGSLPNLKWELRTSLDSFLTPVSSGTPYNSYGFTFDTQSIGDIYSGNTIVFRIYGYGASSTNTSFSLQNAQFIAPPYPSVPEPSPLVLLIFVSIAFSALSKCRTRRCS